MENAKEEKWERDAKAIIAALETALRITNMIIDDYKKNIKKNLLDLSGRKN